MTEEKKEPEKDAPPTVEQVAHINPPIGPTTGKPLRDWRKDRDYEKFNPTAEK
jgi:hypothetical protein